MTKLNLPDFDFKYRLNEKGKKEIFDDVRKKYITLSPEEWVRQNFIHYLIQHRNFPASLMAIERSLKVNTLTKRTDIVQYDKNGRAILIVECKAPNVKIDQDTFAQAAMYNLKMQVNYLIMTNGMHHFCCKINNTTNQLEYLKEVPYYNEL